MGKREVMRILIAGCGYVGTELGLRLAARGDEVFGIRRRAHLLPAPIHPIATDLLDPKLGRHLPPGLEAVVYPAAADESTEVGYRRAYVEGVGNVLAALRSGGAPVKRFLFTSSTAVYGDADGGWVDEDTPPEPENFRGSVVLEGERLAGESGFPTTTLRLGGIYGPGRTRLLEMVREGRARSPEPGPIWTNRIHRDDAAGALAHLLTLPDPAPVYIGVDDEPAPLAEVHRFLADLLGAPQPITDSEMTRDRSNKRCSNRRLRESGHTFRFPTFREGYRAMVEEGA